MTSLIVELDAKTAVLDSKIKKSEATFESLEKEVMSTDKALKNFSNTGTQVSKTATAVNRGIGGIGRSAGQAGIQIQQFIGQVQGGQSAMLALSQQSADLGFVLGAPLLGAVTGIAASLIGILVPSLLSSKDATKELLEEMQKLDDQTKLTRNQAELLVATENKANKERRLRLNEIEKEIKAQENLIAVNNERIELATRGDTAQASLVQNVDELEIALKTLKAEQDTVNASIDEGNKRIKVYSDSIGKTREEVKKGLAGEEIKKQTEGVDKLIETLTTAAATYGLTARQVALYKAEQLSATDAEKEAINAAFDRIDAEKEKQKVLAEGNRFATIGTTEADPQLLAQIIEQESINAQRLENERTYIEAVNQLRLTGQETAEELLARDVEANRLALENKLINLEQFNLAQKQASDRYLKTKDREVKQDQAWDRQRLSQTSAYLGAASTLANAFFEDNKALRASLVIADTAAGIARQFSDLPYPAALATSAAVAASGAVQLAAIASSGDGGSISAPTQSATPTQQQQDFIPETASLDVTTQDGEGVSRQVIVLQDNQGNDLIEFVTNGIQENERRGR